MLELLKTVYSGELLYGTLVTALLFFAVGTATAWAVCSGRHWFLRIGVVGAVLWSALLVPGYDAVLVFFVQAVTAAALLTLIKAWRIRAARRDAGEPKDQPAPWRRRLRFTLTDLLLATVVISAILAVAVRVPMTIWSEWMVIGGFGVVFGIYTCAFVDHVFLFTGKSRLGTLPAPRVRKGRERRRPRAILAAAAWIGCAGFMFLVAFPAAAVYHIVIHPAPLPPISLPEPNGYDDVVREGARLMTVAVPDDETAGRAEIEAFVVKHGYVLDAARQGLKRECQVPLTYTLADISRTENDLLRQLGRAFLAEGKLARLQGRTRDALDSYLDVIRLGKATANGGLYVEAFVGWALEGLALNRLAAMRDALTPDQCRHAIDAIEALDADREPLQEIFERDRLWTHHAFGKAGRALEATGLDFFTDDSERAAEQAAKRTQAKTRLLICELALRQSRLEHESEPTTLEDLVPDYLSAVPLDPYSGEPLRYRPSASGYQLYSVGPDGVDDGGKPMERMHATDVWPGDLHVFEPALDDPAKREQSE